MRILHYGKNDGGHMSQTVRCLKQAGYNAIGLTFYHSHIVNYKGLTVFLLQTAPLFYLRFFYEVLRADVIHIWNGDLIPFTLWFIKLLNKPHVIEWTGGDIRRPELCDFNSTNEYVMGNTEKSLARQRKFRNVINIFSSPILINHCVNKYKVYIPHRIYLPDYPFNPTFHNPLKVCHVTSNREAKGTDLILEAVKDLPIEFDLIENVSNEECIKRVNENDICIGQMLWGENGMQEIEAMAMGKPTLCKINHKESIGVIMCEPESIKRLLEWYGWDLAINQMAPKARQWVEDNCNINKLLKVYRQVTQENPIDADRYLELKKERYELMPYLEFEDNYNFTIDLENII